MTARGPGWWLAIVASVAMLAVTAAGLWALGTPAHQRALRMDARRLQDLRELTGKVGTYWIIHQKLPPDLEHLDANPAQLHDPQSGVPYGYAITGVAQYRLCARFQEPWPNRVDNRIPVPKEPAPGNDSWWHAAGEVCFDRSLKH